MIKGAINTEAQHKVEEITPQRAYELLERNSSNRNVNEWRVKSIAEDIKNGRFLTTHQGVAIGKDGRLLDGQHRLWAIIVANQPVKMMVSYDMDEAILSVIDAGRPRTVSDNFKMLYGIQNNKKIAATINLIQQMVTGHYPHLTTNQAHEVYQQFKDGVDWASEDMRGNNAVGKTAVIAALALAYKTDAEKTKEFAAKLKSGSGLSEGSPILAARNFLLLQLPRVKIEASKVALKIMRALYCHINGEPATKLFESQGETAFRYFGRAYGLFKNDPVIVAVNKVEAKPAPTVAVKPANDVEIEIVKTVKAPKGMAKLLPGNVPVAKGFQIRKQIKKAANAK